MFGADAETYGNENRSGNVMKTGVEAEANSFGSTTLCHCLSSLLIGARWVAKNSYIRNLLLIILDPTMGAKFAAKAVNFLAISARLF